MLELLGKAALKAAPIVAMEIIRGLTQSQRSSADYSNENSGDSHYSDTDYRDSRYADPGYDN